MIWSAVCQHRFGILDQPERASVRFVVTLQLWNRTLARSG